MARTRLPATIDRDLSGRAGSCAMSGGRRSVEGRAEPRPRSMLLRDGKRKHEGPGITLEERTKVVTRFYRLDRSWSLPGNGLDLAIVTAISHLHGDSLALEDAAP